ncbi:glycosyltransferase [Phenylobacterium sp.]|uniref:glycosyltransferase n=1 Tax=Phenylobacterium sp. TaxID=1871053 RepID=UPI0035B275E1
MRAAEPRLRILLVVPSFPPDVHGGAERQAALLAEALGRLGCQVRLLAPTVTGAEGVEATAYGSLERLRLSALPASGGRHLGATLAWTARTARRIVARRAELDLAYVFHHRLHVAGPLLGGALANLPVFVKPGGGGEASEFAALRRKKYLYGRFVARRVVRDTAGFIANSTTIAEDLRREGVGGERIYRIPNGVAPVPSAAFAAARPGRDGTRLVYAGRLVPDKGVERLIEAAALLPRDRPWTLTILGDGPERRPLAALAAERGLAGRVALPGHTGDAPAELLRHDIFVSPSLREGQSNALLEALAAGLIPVCAPASGVEELVDPDLGVVTRDATPERLSAGLAAMLGLAAPERLRRSAALHAWANQQFAIDAVARATRAAFVEVLQRRGRPAS